MLIKAVRECLNESVLPWAVVPGESLLRSSLSISSVKDGSCFTALPRLCALAGMKGSVKMLAGTNAANARSCVHRWIASVYENCVVAVESSAPERLKDLRWPYAMQPMTFMAIARRPSMV